MYAYLESCLVYVKVTSVYPLPPYDPVLAGRPLMNLCIAPGRGGGGTP